MRSPFGVSIAVVCAALFSVPAWSHHSHGSYEDTFMDIEGVVKEVHLLVPHSWIYLEVKDPKGEAQVWALEATGRHRESRRRSGRDRHRVGRQGAGGWIHLAGNLRRFSGDQP